MKSVVIALGVVSVLAVSACSAPPRLVHGKRLLPVTRTATSQKPSLMSSSEGSASHDQ